METRLKSVFQNPKLRLVNKALIFAALLWVLQAGDFGFWPMLLFLGGAGFLYAVPMFRTVETASIFALLLINTVFVLNALGSLWYFWMAASYFTVLFYLLLGVKDLSFVRRDSWRRLLAFGLAYPALLVFFYYHEANIALRIALLFLELAILTKSIFYQRIHSWLINLLSLEVAWATLFLPIGFISQAGIAALFYFLLTDTVHHYAKKQMSRRLLLVHVTIMVILTMAVLGFSRWSA